MSDPYLCEIRPFAGNFNPRGWATCEGQLLPTQQNAAAFNLLRTTYGGDGVRTFGLPDLRGRFAMHRGPNHVEGELNGVEAVALDNTTLPSHSHTFMASTGIATTGDPTNNVVATTPDVHLEIEAPADGTMAANVTAVPGSVPHSNLQPYLGIVYIIALTGIFPSQG